MNRIITLIAAAAFMVCCSRRNTIIDDWLIDPGFSQSYVTLSSDGKDLTIGNAMVSRTFRLEPSLSTISLLNKMTGEEMVRAASPEAVITLDGTEHLLGGLSGQRERGFLLPEWLDGMTPADGFFHLKGYTEGVITEKIHWARSRWALNKEAATGRTVTFEFEGEGGIAVRLTYSVYDHLPVISKQFELLNGGQRNVTVDSFKLEHLAFVEPDSPSGGDPDDFILPNIHVESDYNCRGSFSHIETDITTHWVEDPEYTSQRNYNLGTRCILDVKPPIGPAQVMAPGEPFTSFTVYEMPYDSRDRERKGLFDRHFYRAVAPWTTENPIFLHLTSVDPETVRTAVDQCADVGYEMVIISFNLTDGDLDMEDVSPENIARFKDFVDYAHSKGIEMGCYSLLASRSVDDENDCINPATGRPGGMTFGNSPCLCSGWGEKYFENIEKFLDETGMKCLEHDGSYPGDVCASTSHPGHRGLEDSQWNQFRKIAEFYHRLSEKGIYMNVPDFYFLNGTNKTSIGYREVNWSLPRASQIIHTRQLNHDCTYERPQSGVWSFVPLTQYHGGGEAATIEPLHEHLYEYKTLMFQNYSAGVQACYRGPRLYDTEETRQAVKELITWYKKYRVILNSDIIHLRKADGRDWDGLMHVNPSGDEKGLAVFYNPLDEPITRIVKLPLYYTGLDTRARIREQEGPLRTYRIARDWSVDLEVTIPAKGYTWYVIE